MGHIEIKCWSRKTVRKPVEDAPPGDGVENKPTAAPESAEASEESEEPTKVAAMSESDYKEAVAATKHTVSGEPLLKQRRESEW